MVKISFEHQEIAVPESWADVRLADICGLDVDVFLSNPTQLFDVVTEMVSFVFKDFEGEPKNEILVDGVEYRISFTDELTLAEWVDVEAVFGEDRGECLSEILAILCRPSGEVYDSRLSEGRKVLFRELSMDKVLPLIAFFLLQRKKSQHVLSLYSEVREEVNQYLQLIHSFVENGDGIKSLPIWQRIRYYFLMRSLKKQLSKFSDSCFTSSTKDVPKMNKTAS